MFCQVKKITTLNSSCTCYGPWRLMLFTLCMTSRTNLMVMERVVAMTTDIVYIILYDVTHDLILAPMGPILPGAKRVRRFAIEGKKKIWLISLVGTTPKRNIANFRLPCCRILLCIYDPRLFCFPLHFQMTIFPSTLPKG